MVRLFQALFHACELLRYRIFPMTTSSMSSTVMMFIPIVHLNVYVHNGEAQICTYNYSLS